MLIKLLSQGGPSTLSQEFFFPNTRVPPPPPPPHTHTHWWSSSPQRVLTADSTANQGMVLRATVVGQSSPHPHPTLTLMVGYACTSIFPHISLLDFDPVHSMTPTRKTGLQGLISSARAFSLGAKCWQCPHQLEYISSSQAELLSVRVGRTPSLCRQVMPRVMGS